MKINGKTLVATGGASGFGEVCIRRFHAAGASVVICDLNEERGKAIEKELGEKCLFVKTDVTSEADVSALCAAAVKKFGAIHILVNCAGIAPPKRILGKEGPIPLDDFKKVININLIGTFNTLSKVAWEMSKNTTDEDEERGVIINTASAAAFEGQIGQAAYSASKGGIVSLTLTAARDLARNAIRVCTIAPSTFLTPMADTLSAEVIESLARQVPFPQRLGNPAEFGSLVQFMVENGYMNGETVRLDGAVRMGPR
ncbi:MAG: 3-hydroxyacyl-CoA dehydrogenase [Gracilibacteraceae bacterium]|jgi:NAD(P)-dependent dehydrogenase (short-subunit alcohol dehydrogenase family)|nr:3-hydroxyacyl-CoA dehydrogenase [Gracilibacteraceae bacterium]